MPTPTPYPTIEISEPHFYKDGSEITQLEGGTLQCRMEINNGTSAPGVIPSVMLVGVYDENDRFVCASVAETEKTLAAGETEVLTAAITIPAGNTGDHYVKVFLWDDLDSMMPECAAWIFNSMGISIDK